MDCNQTNLFDSIDETLTGTTIPSQGGPGSNGNEGILLTSQSSRTGASPPDPVLHHIQDTVNKGFRILGFLLLYFKNPAKISFLKFLFFKNFSWKNNNISYTISWFNNEFIFFSLCWNRIGILPTFSHDSTMIWLQRLNFNGMPQEKQDENYTWMLHAVFKNPGSSTPQNNSCMVTYLQSHK